MLNVNAASLDGVSVRTINMEEYPEPVMEVK